MSGAGSRPEGGGPGVLGQRLCGGAVGHVDRGMEDAVDCGGWRRLVKDGR